MHCLFPRPFDFEAWIWAWSKKPTSLKSSKVVQSPAIRLQTRATGGRHNLPENLKKWLKRGNSDNSTHKGQFTHHSGKLLSLWKLFAMFWPLWRSAEKTTTDDIRLLQEACEAGKKKSQKHNYLFALWGKRIWCLWRFRTDTEVKIFWCLTLLLLKISLLLEIFSVFHNLFKFWRFHLLLLHTFITFQRVILHFLLLSLLLQLLMSQINTNKTKICV